MKEFIFVDSQYFRQNLPFYNGVCTAIRYHNYWSLPIMEAFCCHAVVRCEIDRYLQQWPVPLQYSPSHISPYWDTSVNTAYHIAHVDTVASTAYIGWHIDIGARDYAPCRQYHNICESTVILASLQISKHVSLFITLSYLSNIVFSPLNLKHRETHGCLVSTVATDALVLKHQAISILSTD